MGQELDWLTNHEERDALGTNTVYMAGQIAPNIYSKLSNIYILPKSWGRSQLHRIE